TEVSQQEANKRLAAEGERVLGKERFEQYQKLKEELAALQKPDTNQEMGLCVTEQGRTAPDSFVLLRGNAHVHGPKVEPAFPSMCGGGTAFVSSPEESAHTCGRRTALANWIASKDNLLTARVMANR